MSMRTAALLLVLIGVGANAGQNREASAVAVIADATSGPDLRALGSLLEAGLSADQTIRLLERTQIERVLAEQQLSAAGLEQRDGVIKAGRLLRADAFVLLSLEPTAAGAGSKSPTGRLVRVRVAETAHGLRLWEGYESLEATNVEALAWRIVQKVRPALDKITQLDGQAVPVGIVDIHRVQLPEKYEYLARALPGLLSARLGKERRIIMLERESLGVLLREKQLTEGSDAAFWNSAILIDGYLQPSESEGIEMTLRLRNAAGRELAGLLASVDPNRPSGAIENVSIRIINTVSSTSPGVRWDPAREADEFYKQGLLLYVHARRAAAHPCLEAAHALQPQNVAYTGTLFAASLPARTTPSQPERLTDAPVCTELELAELASLLARQIRGLSEGNEPPTWTKFEYGPAALRDYLERSISAATEQIRAINRENRRIWCEMSDRQLKSEAAKQKNGAILSGGYVENAWLSSDDPEEVMAALRQCVNQVILPPSMGGMYNSNDWRCHSCHLNLYSRAGVVLMGDLEDTHLHGSEERVRALWDAYVEELTVCRDPLAKFFACATRVHQMTDARRDRASAMKYCRLAVDTLLNELHSPNEPLNDSMKWQIRRVMTQCLRVAPYSDANEVADLRMRILTPLVDAEDTHNLALWDPGEQYVHVGSREVMEQQRRLLARIDEVFANHDNDPQVLRARARLKDTLRWTQPRGAGGNAVPDAPNLRATMLLRGSDWPRKSGVVWGDPQFVSRADWVQTVIHDDTLWIGYFFLRSSLPGPSSMALVSLDLSRREPRSIWWIALPAQNQLAGFVVRPDAVYLDITDVGIVVLARRDEDVREIVLQPNVLTEANGLPSRGVTGIADAGYRLWVAYGSQASSRGDRESGLGLYDPAKGTWERVFCSSEQGNPPFSAGRPYALSHLTPIEDELFFFVDRTLAARPEDSADGLWRMNVKTKALTYFGSTDSGHVIRDGTRLLSAAKSSLVEFDMETEKARLLCGEPSWRQPRSQLPVKALTPERVGAVDEALKRRLAYGPAGFGTVDPFSTAIHENRIWATLGESQVVVIPMPGAGGDVITLKNNLLDGAAVVRFVSTPHGLVGIGHGTAGMIDTRMAPDSSR